MSFKLTCVARLLAVTVACAGPDHTGGGVQTSRRVAVAPPADPRAVDTLPCPTPPGASAERLRLDLVRGLAGTYALRLVEDSSAEHPHTATTTGTLWLWRTSARDSSVHYGVHAAPGDTAGYPLYGAIDADLAAVHVPVDSVPRWPGGARRAAVDPVAPFVLAQVWEPPPPGMPYARLGILVGTIADRRPDVMSTDGSGVGLWVTGADSGALRGPWSEYGIVPGGRGHFCAVRVGP